MAASNNYINSKFNSIKHGISQHPIYKTWISMKSRCYNKSPKQYKNYGGRGITVCNEWINNPLLFFNWGLDNGWKQGLTIDRINNNGNYEPNNCRWATRKQQAQNNRNATMNLGRAIVVRKLYKLKCWQNKTLANFYNVTERTISNITTNKTWD